MLKEIREAKGFGLEEASLFSGYPVSQDKDDYTPEELQAGLSRPTLGRIELGARKTATGTHFYNLEYLPLTGFRNLLEDAYELTEDEITFIFYLVLCNLDAQYNEADELIRQKRQARIEAIKAAGQLARLHARQSHDE